MNETEMLNFNISHLLLVASVHQRLLNTFASSIKAIGEVLDSEIPDFAERFEKARSEGRSPQDTALVEQVLADMQARYLAWDAMLDRNRKAGS